MNLFQFPVRLTLIFAIFFNLLAWQIIVPIWHFPDEQAHFGQVAFRAEHGRSQAYHELSTNSEIAISEELLKTKRDAFGNNSFTYHPEFKIEYSPTFIGPYETQIESLNNVEYRKKEIQEESTRYPPLYYFLASNIYNLFGESDLFARVYAVRFLSVLIFTAISLAVFLVSKQIFPKSRFLQISLISMIVFMPMFVFSVSGVTSDGLFILLFMLSLYLIAKPLYTKLGTKDSFLLLALIIAGISTKFQFQIIWLPLFYVIFVLFIKMETRKKLFLFAKTVIVLPLFLIAVNFLYYYVNGYGNPNLKQLLRLPIIPDITEVSDVQINLTFIDYLQNTFARMIREVLPWYFGVFKWLSLTLPPIFYKIINRLLILSFIGLLIWLVKLVRQKKPKLGQEVKLISFHAFTSAAYFSALVIFDWFFINKHGFPFGIQGRYFFPTIIAHVGLVFVGLLVLFPKSFKKWAAAVLVIGVVVFNYFSLFWVASHYYDLGSFNTFITQASQYKPEIFKGTAILLILSMSLLSSAFYISKYLIVVLRTNQVEV
ncbi:MAG: DUF2142 domain-containing protein [Candidatus Curtissbacteria bacterium]|nr:DUF2142 domain-containing protein [Candidatus Curtissbacteria bacterium]